MPVERDGAVPHIDVRGVSVTVRDAVEPIVLADVDLAVGAGDLVALVGPSGSGKTTLLNVIGGLEPDFTGSVLVNGRAVWSTPESERAAFRNRAIGFVFQNANLIQGLTAEENLLIPLLLRNMDRRSARTRAQDLLDRLGLERKRTTRVERLSGGERQRVATARALMGQPEILLVDEPTGQLDEANATRITDTLLGYADEQGATMVIATHDERVMARATRVVRMDQGGAHEAR